MQICEILSDNGQKHLPDNVSGGFKNLPDNSKIHRHLSVFRYLIAALVPTQCPTGRQLFHLGLLQIPWHDPPIRWSMIPRMSHDLSEYIHTYLVADQQYDESEDHCNYPPLRYPVRIPILIGLRLPSPSPPIDWLWYPPIDWHVLAFIEAAVLPYHNCVDPAQPPARSVPRCVINLVNLVKIWPPFTQTTIKLPQCRQTYVIPRATFTLCTAIGEVCSLSTETRQQLATCIVALQQLH